MLEKIEQLNKLKQNLTSELRKWVKDKSIPLNERWVVFFKSDLGEHVSSIEDFVNLNSDDVYDTYQPERYITIYLSDIRDYGIKSLESDEDYDAFREDVLNKFIKSYRWDW